MRHRALGSLGAVALMIVFVLGVSVGVGGQAPKSTAPSGTAPSGTRVFDETATNTDAAIKAATEVAKGAATVAKNWTAPRTSWGDPDIQGYYFNHSSYTPLERPAALGDKAFYTEEEAAAVF